MIFRVSLFLWAFLFILFASAPHADAIAAAPAAPPAPAPRPNPNPNTNPKPNPNTNPRPNPNTGPKPPNLNPKPLPKVVGIRLPDEEGITIEDDASVFSLGSYSENDEQALFANFDGNAKPFFSKIYDFFGAQEGYLATGNVEVYADATGSAQPFDKDVAKPSGKPIRITRVVQDSPTKRTITANFDPVKPTDVCRAWKSIASYCDDKRDACACYSGTYYVPDQWNSLAAGCARATSRCSSATTDPWCQIAQTANSYKDYCVTDKDQLGDTRIVKFAAVANKPQDQPDANPTPDAAPAPDDTPASDPPVTTRTPASSSTSTSARITSTSTYRPSFVVPTTPIGSGGSGASSSLDAVFANRYPQVFLMVVLMLFLRGRVHLR